MIPPATDHPQPVTDPEALAALARVGQAEDLTRRVGACEHPIVMRGRSLLVDPATGQILHRPDATTVGMRCRNRRATVCVACSTLYKFDAYHLVAAGLRGGKDTPETVAQHPRLFITLTAPSFGAVHIGPDHTGTPRLCHPGTTTRPAACGRWHAPGDPDIGTPLDAQSYDYAGQVLFSAHAGVLWSKTTTAVRRAFADQCGIPIRHAAKRVRVVFAKVAEFQTRGVVHYHALVRVDGPDGPGSPPPGWASSDRLTEAIRHAATTVAVATPAAPTSPARMLRWGVQIDIQPLPAAGSNRPDDPDARREASVARYLAKYATKAAETVGVTIAPIYCRTCSGIGARAGGLCHACHGTGRRPGVDLGTLSPHARALVDACWRLGGRPEYRHLRLRRWAHQLGYRGHYTTKSHTFSTTFAALRQERRAHAEAGLVDRVGGEPGVPVLVVGDWSYHGPAV
ncbi:replication initiator [Luedemannella helvata]|uniref:Replication initiator protein RepSA n=1 Tax=Luedemannella helvata TaxID=349315 RepID=A0ABN2L7J0_9ACTN